MAQVLGIDYGLRRIGLAIGDAQLKIATPMRTIEGRGDAVADARAVMAIAAEHEAADFVVGLPLNMADGSDSEQTRLARRFAEELARQSGKPVHLHDERLSSFAADELLGDAGVSTDRRDGRRDRVAAQQILQAYLDSQGPGGF